MYRAVLFDLDGTLVYTKMEYVNAVFRKAFAQLGCVPTEEQILHIWNGKDTDGVIRSLGVEPLEYWRVHRVHDLIDERVLHTECYDDVAETLAWLHAHGCRIGIVTGAPSNVARKEIALLGAMVRPEDPVIIANDLGGLRFKPDPHGILECLSRLKIPPSEAIYVGNAEEDVLAAQRAGVLDVLIRRDGCPTPDVVPTVTIRSLKELKDIVTSQRI